MIVFGSFFTIKIEKIAIKNVRFFKFKKLTIYLRYLENPEKCKKKVQKYFQFLILDIYKCPKLKS